jgi:hypothetical protein
VFFSIERNLSLVLRLAAERSPEPAHFQFSANLPAGRLREYWDLADRMFWPGGIPSAIFLIVFASLFTFWLPIGGQNFVKSVGNSLFLG